MDDKLELKIMFWFTACYITIFTFISLIKRNYEFLFYTFIISILLFIIIKYYRKVKLTRYILLGLTILGALHIFGGNVFFVGTRLYEIWLIPSILRYDNFVHAFGSFVITFIVYSLLNRNISDNIHNNNFMLSLLLVSIAMGVGAFNEILEFMAVLFLGVQTQVGDYFNNALDLIFNLLGAIIACFFIIKDAKKNNLN